MKIRGLLLLLALGMIAVPNARADEEYDKLLREFEDAQQNWFEKLQKIGDEKEGEAKDKGAFEALDMSKLPPHPAAEFMPRFRRYAEQHAGEPEAIPALAWIVGSGRQAASGEAPPISSAVWAVKRLTKDHAAQPEIKDALPRLRYAAWDVGRKPLKQFYLRILWKNKDPEVVGGARFNLACTLKEAGPSEGEDEKRLEADRQQAHELFERVVKDAPSEDLKEAAEGFLFEMDHLQVGMVAPDFIGTDAEGNEIKLSQFRGQVVVLDFWGFW